MVAGRSYGYRLVSGSGSATSVTTETWLDVPAALEFSLGSLSPNPASAASALTITLPGDASASLEVIDVSGRRVASQNLGTLGAGTHTIALSAAARLSSGIYFLRLDYQGRALPKRIALVP